MRKALIVGGALVAALAVPASAAAGCWATVGLAPPPKGIGPGEVWKAELTVLQHGRTPLSHAKPTVTVVNATTGERRTVAAKLANADRGRYTANVVFPSAGAWRYQVFDGFTTYAGEQVPCARTHTFASVNVGAPAAGRGGSGGGGGGVSTAVMSRSPPGRRRRRWRPLLWFPSPCRCPSPGRRCAAPDPGRGRT